MAEEIPRRSRFSELADLDRLTCPVLSIIGDEGFQADDPYLLQALLPDCRTVIIDGQDHSVLVEAHREVRRLVIDWVLEHHLTGDATADVTAVTAVTEGAPTGADAG